MYVPCPVLSGALFGTAHNLMFFSSPQENGAGDSLVIPLTELSDAGRYQCVVNTTGFQPYRSPQATLTVKGTMETGRYSQILG